MIEERLPNCKCGKTPIMKSKDLALGLAYYVHCDCGMATGLFPTPGLARRCWGKPDAQAEMKGFAQGLAYSIGFIQSLGENTLADQIIHESGFSAEELSMSLSDPIDIDKMNEFLKSGSGSKTLDKLATGK